MSASTTPSHHPAQRQTPCLYLLCFDEDGSRLFLFEEYYFERCDPARRLLVLLTLLAYSPRDAKLQLCARHPIFAPVARFL